LSSLPSSASFPAAGSRLGDTGPRERADRFRPLAMPDLESHSKQGAGRRPKTHRGSRRAARSILRDAQRGRLLLGCAEAANERGVADVTVAEIVTRAGVSRRTFYELFDSAEACLLAAFEEAVRQATVTMRQGCEQAGDWPARMRAGLVALLGFLDEQRTLGRFAVVEALGAGEEVRRARLAAVARLVDLVDEGRQLARTEAGLSRTTAEGLVGGALSIVHTRLLQEPRQPMLNLLGELMAMLLRPYLGASVAAAELERAPAPAAVLSRWQDDVLHGVKLRWTYRTMRVLGSVGADPGASNRQVGALAGIVDQGQTSKLLTRLERLGLLENRCPHPGKEPNAWFLTPLGEELEAVVGREL
jgi:AcrR family transcriptional regulator